MELGIVVFVAIALFQPTNVHTAGPSFPKNIISTQIHDDSPPETFYKTFVATEYDENKKPLTYSLEAKALEWFAINSSTGNTTVKKKIDRESIVQKSESYTFFVYATNTADEKATAKVILQIIDVNNKPPVIENLPNTVNIPEDKPVGETLFTVTITDADDGVNALTIMNIDSGNEDGTFRVDNTKIVLNKSLDYDKGKKQYILNITANNTEAPYPHTSSVLTINVQNVDDLGFKFLEKLYTSKVVKGSSLGTLVVKVKAEDLDLLNETAEYKINPASNPGDYYVINSKTGEITLNGQPEIGNRLLVVEAISKKHGAEITLVNITVVAVLEVPFQIDATEGETSIVVFNLLFTEPKFNVTGASFTFQSGNHGNHFVIESTNLKIGSESLDRETLNEYTLVIKLTKDGAVRGLATVVVKVLDINDNSPHFQLSSYEVTVKEDLDIGNDIVKVSATDPDQGLNGTVKYTITNGNHEGMFTIDNTTGQITLLAHLDHEKTSIHILTVQAYDCGVPSRTNSTNITINVVDVNDNSPVIKPTIVYVKVPEDAADGLQVTVVSATDADAGQNAKITYSISTGAEGHFTINADSGAITKTGQLSHKIKSTYTITVVAKDNGTSPRSTISVVMVTVIAVTTNNHKPIFKSSFYLGGVYKDTSDIKIILTVIAEDADSGSNGDVEYRIINGSTNGLFFMDSHTGVLKTAGSFTEKEGETYELTVQANDKASPSKLSDPNTAIHILVLRASYSVAITSGVKQEDLLSRIQEFQTALDEMTGGKAFIKSVRPGNEVNSTVVLFNVIDPSNKTEKTYDEIEGTLQSKQSLITGKYKKWGITYGRPKTSALTSEAGGLSAVVGAMICLAIMIGVGGIIMIVILIKKKRERERVCKAARVTFSDKPQFIDPVSKTRSSNNVENAQEAQEVIVHMTDENSSIASEDIETSPHVLNYINDAYQKENDSDDDESEKGENFYMDGETVNFGTFFPPPPTQPPPPIPESETGESSLHSEEVSIPSDEDEDEEEDEEEEAVLPPHQDFADPNHDYEVLHQYSESPPQSTTDSTTNLVGSPSYKNSLLHDPNFGFGALRTSTNNNLTTEL